MLSLEFHILGHVRDIDDYVEPLQLYQIENYEMKVLPTMHNKITD